MVPFPEPGAPKIIALIETIVGCVSEEFTTGSWDWTTNKHEQKKIVLLIIVKNYFVITQNKNTEKLDLWSLYLQEFITFCSIYTAI